MIKFNAEARGEIRKGINILTDAVKVTLGPKGRNVAIQQYPIPPHITKDGVTVARAIELKNQIQNLGARLIKDVAHKTCIDAGDGTTTSVILAQAIYNEGLKHLDNGVSVSLLKSGVEKAVKEVVNYLDEIKIDIHQKDTEMLYHVALVSSNQDKELSTILSETLSKIGSDGVLTIEDSRTGETYIDITEGLQLDKGYVNTYFGSGEKEECILEDCMILVADGKVNSEKDLIPILDLCGKSGKSLLIVCDEIEPKPLSIILTNTLQHRLKACVVFSPGFGESRKHKIKDLLSVVGGSIWKSGDQFDLGSAEKVIVDINKTVIIGGKGDPKLLLDRIKTLQELVKSDFPEGTIQKLQQRLAALVNGIAILYIGAQSEIEAREKKDRADDTIKALQAALQEGIVSGGGSEYIRASRKLELSNNDNYDNDELIGKEIIIKALLTPFYQICANADIVTKMNTISFIRPRSGYNIMTNKEEDLVSSGIIDPKKVLRIALENAASVASSLLTTECVIIKEEKVPLIN